MSAWREEQGLKWRRLEPFGIEIGSDLSAPLSEAGAKRFVGLFHDAGLIVAHGQKLSMEQQTALMALLGPILRRPGESGYMTTEHAHGSARAELKFHADAAYTSSPFDALSLHAVDVVNGASSTRFASAERGYATMPAALRGKLLAHDVDMISPGYETLSTRACDMRDPVATRGSTRPSVLVNPRTGRECIGVSEMHAARMLDMAWEDSRALLNAVFDHLYAPANTVDHVWHLGDLVIWDNITFQHARGSLERAGKRVLQRVLVGTEVPEHAVAGASQRRMA